MHAKQDYRVYFRRKIHIDNPPEIWYSQVMEIKFNSERLKDLVMDLYHSLHIPITLYDREFHNIQGCVGPNAYCDIIRAMPWGRGACRESNEKHFKIVSQTKTMLIYTCHAGLCEVITPILYENVVIAYLMLGKFRDEKQEYSSLKRIRQAADFYGLDRNTMVRAYRKVPVLTERELQDTINVVNICIQHIWNENLISLNKNMLPAKIETYVSENLESELSVAELCRKFYISRQVLYALFRDEFGDTVGNYILNKRLTEAKRLLKETGSPISDIARTVGFADYSYFIRLFRKHIGMTPLQYRKNSGDRKDSIGENPASRKIKTER